MSPFNERHGRSPNLPQEGRHLPHPFLVSAQRQRRLLTLPPASTRAEVQADQAASSTTHAPVALSGWI